MRRQSAFPAKKRVSTRTFLIVPFTFKKTNPKPLFMLLERSDSDQSISDEEEFDRVTYDHGCLESLRSLYERGKKDQLQVASQLEILEEEQLHSTGAHELNLGRRRTSTALEELLFSEEVFKMHELQNVEGDSNQYHPRKIFSTGSDDEAISDEADDKENNVLSKISCNPGATKFSESHLHNIEHESQHGACAWSAILKEADELVCLHENVGSSSSHAANSEGRRHHQASGSKAKLKFSIRSRACNEALIRSSMVNDETTNSFEANQVPTVLETLENRITKHSIAELLEGLQDESGNLSKAPQVPGEAVALVHRDTEHSISDLLEGLKEKMGPSEGTSRMNTKRRFELAGSRTLCPLGDRALDNEDPLETMDYGMSSEDEDTCQNQLTVATAKIKCQTMVDRFQEAFSSAAVDDERTLFPINKQTGIGYYGRLQQVMQKEKETQMEFLKQLQTGVGAEDESGSLVVQILSRYLDAKLTVCLCSFGDKSKISQSMNSLEKLVHGGENWKGKIVFNPRICGNVELEVGNLIRIYPPCFQHDYHPLVKFLRKVAKVEASLCGELQWKRKMEYYKLSILGRFLIPFGVLWVVMP
ncbi:hypothetical protein CKAN_02328600 [Cinnamomum micranthum f. kanehirae]|uniref:Uncharacterized protein n=1 Tax=Cinnamomum micranthum f. kanehirae TaxID=337451 RepID=A0A3S3P5T2_9MAGN|nr:hypothetical protein CKAN_02328600 [Cinnamomum micranthum f. kanehirae]